MKNQSAAVRTPVPDSSSSFFIDTGKLLASIVDVVCAFDEQGIIRYISPSCRQLFGYEPGEMEGLSFLQFIHPNDVKKTIQIFSERKHDCHTSNFSSRYSHKNGTLLSILWSARWDENDRLLYCVARDGSEKSEMEQRLLKSQQMARVANYEYDVVNKCYTYLSDTFFELLGIDRNHCRDFNREDYWNLIHVEDRDMVRNNNLQPDPLYHTRLDYRMIRSDGKIIYIHRQRELIYDAEGNPVKIIGIMQDVTDRRSSELAVQQSEERFRSMVQNGNDLISILDAECRYSFVSDNVERHLGFTAEELLGQSAFHLIHPDDVEHVAAFLPLLEAQKTLFIPPFRFSNSKGEWRWMETAVSNHLDNPAIGGLVINSKDVTERKQKDDELRKLSLIAQEAQNPILISSLQNEITWANKAFLELSGCSEEEVIGKRTDETFLSSMMNLPTRLQFQADLEAGKTVYIEGQFCSKTGADYWLDLTIQPFMCDSGTTVCFLAIGKDITEKKKAELAREQTEQRFRALVQNGSDLIVIIDKEGNFSYCSNNVTNILGYEQEEMKGLNAFAFIHPDDAQKVAKEIETILRDGQNAKGVQHRFLHRNGNWVWLESKGTDHQLTESIHGILVNSRNITDRVMLQKKLHRELVNKQKEITSAVIKAQEAERSQLGLELHDNVNQILTTVKLYNEMYLTGYMQDKELLVKSMQYTQECINEIRSISKRLSAPTLGRISLQDSIKELVDSINLTGRLEILYIPQGIEQRCFSHDLHLAIYRIVQEGLNNILKYSQAQVACIAIRRKQGTICLTITDNGKGFDTTAKQTGIGITNMKTRAENLQGEFKIISSPGKGCEIRICFPCEEEE